MELVIHNQQYGDSRYNCVLGRDITERKQAEEALRKSEWYLRSTLDGLSAHITVLDDQGEIILTNKAYRDFGERNGIEPRAVSEGVNYLAVCDTASGEHSEEATPFAEGIREVLSGKCRSFELEYPCHSPGEERWFFAHVTPFAGEGPRRVIVAHENITERKRAEDELKESKTFLDNMSDGAYVADHQGNLLWVNTAVEQMTGLPCEQMIGEPFLPLFVETDHASLINVYQRR